MPLFTPEEKELLKQYVTSTEDDVFAIKNLSGIVGAIFARYSRAKGTFRETLLKEFIKEGVIDRSYGIHVAEMLKFPEEVLNEARQLAEALENF